MTRPGIGRGYGVPELGLAVVEVVDGVEVHVLRVPGEGRLPHPEVQVGRVHTADLYIVILVDPVKDGPELLNVPNLAIIKSIICNGQ